MSEQLHQIVLVNEDTSGDVLVNEAVCLLLFKETNIFGFYMKLRYLERKKWTKWDDDQKLYYFLGISKNTFYEYRNRLVGLGIIKVTDPHTDKTRIVFQEVKFPDVLKGKIIIGEDFRMKVLPQTVKEILKVNSPDYQKEIKKVEEMQEQQHLFDTQVTEKVKEIEQKKKQKKKAEEKKFPGADYRIVLDGYTKYKHVGLKGNEVLRAKHAIKNMFLAERTPKQIVDCMKFFDEVKDEPENMWMRSWTLETIMKKIPEFIAGQLDTRVKETPIDNKERLAIMYGRNDPSPDLDD